MIVSVDNGDEQEVGSRTWQFVGPLSWLPDGKSLIMIAAAGEPALWELSYPSGETRRITNDLNEYFGVSLNGDASSLVTVQREVPTSHMWVVTPGAGIDRSRAVDSRRSGDFVR